MRTVSGPPQTAEPFKTLELACDSRLLKTPRQAPPSPGGEGWDEGERHSGFSTLNYFSPGPVTRQYAAISGNKRTKAQFLAAYCRLSVRVLPLNQFLCRVKPLKVRSSSFSLPTPRPMPRAFRFNCQRTRSASMHDAWVSCSRLTAYSSLSWGILLPTNTDSQNNTLLLFFVKFFDN